MKSRPQRGEPLDDSLAEQLAWLLDDCFKIGPWSIGIDGFLGLIPGLGDFASGALSALIIARAIQNGVPRAAVLRMLSNVAIDSLVGSIPVVGDAFDFAFKSNKKNITIYRESMSGERRQAKDWLFLILVLLALLVLIALPILGFVYLVKLVAPHLPGI